MKNKITLKTTLLCTVTLCLGSYSVQAQSITSGPRYMPRAEVSDRNYTQIERTEDHMDKQSYEQYEEREPCQNYRNLPRNQTDNCATSAENVDPAPAAVEVSSDKTRKLLPIVHSYTVLFDFDKSSIRANEMATLDKVVSEIGKYNPEQITVTGYTDSSGAVAYNQTLSLLREQAVSKALLARSIENQTIAREARGEFNQAVVTPDDTKNQENRRVVIDLRR